MGAAIDGINGCRFIHLSSGEQITRADPKTRLEYAGTERCGSLRIFGDTRLMKADYSMMMSLTDLPPGIIGSTCSWYGQITSSR